MSVGIPLTCHMLREPWLRVPLTIDGQNPRQLFVNTALFPPPLVSYPCCFPLSWPTPTSLLPLSPQLLRHSPFSFSQSILAPAPSSSSSDSLLSLPLVPFWPSSVFFPFFSSPFSLLSFPSVCVPLKSWYQLLPRIWQLRVVRCETDCSLVYCWLHYCNIHGPSLSPCSGLHTL